MTLAVHGHDTIHRGPEPHDARTCLRCLAHKEKLAARARELAEEWAGSAIDLLADHSEPSVQLVSAGLVKSVPVARARSDENGGQRLSWSGLYVLFPRVVACVYAEILDNLTREAGDAHDEDDES